MLNLQGALGSRATRWFDHADAPEADWVGAVGAALDLGRTRSCPGTSHAPRVRSPHSRECHLGRWGSSGHAAAPGRGLRTSLRTGHRARERPPGAARRTCPRQPLRLLRRSFRLRSARVRSSEICHIPCGCVVPSCDRTFACWARKATRYYMEDTYSSIHSLLRGSGRRSVERGALQSKRRCSRNGRDRLIPVGSQPSRVNVISVFTCA